MKVLLLGDRRSTADDILVAKGVQDMLEVAGHQVEVVIPSCDELEPCTGCFGCWLRTPGQCVITKDDANGIASKLINSDAVVLVSEIVFGGFSADIKAFLDRNVQNILPIFEIYKGEMHHPGRYERFPTWIAVGYGDVSDEEKQTFCLLADRNALNIRPSGHLAVTVKDSAGLASEAERVLGALEVTQ